MKTILIAGLLALACTTLVVDPCVAQAPCNNLVGLYNHPEGTGPPRATMQPMETLSIYLVLCRPSSCEKGYDPLTDVSGFECALRFDPVPDNDLLLIDKIYQGETVTMSGRNDMNEGTIDFLTAFVFDLRVADDAVALVELEFLNMGAGTTDIYLEPYFMPSIPGEMAFCSGCPDQGGVMHPVSGSHELPVFQLQSGAVAIESMSYGTVKALYR